MNGKRHPGQRQRPDDPSDVDDRLKGDEHTAPGDQESSPSGSPQRRASRQQATGEHAEQDDDETGSQQAELLSQDGEDHVACAPWADTGTSARSRPAPRRTSLPGPERDQRLSQLEARTLRDRPRDPEGEHPAHPLADLGEGSRPCRRREARSGEQSQWRPFIPPIHSMPSMSPAMMMAVPRSRSKTTRRHMRQAASAERPHVRAETPVGHSPAGEKMRPEQDHRELGEFGRLIGERPQRDPTGRRRPRSAPLRGRGPAAARTPQRPGRAPNQRPQPPGSRRGTAAPARDTPSCRGDALVPQVAELVSARDGRRHREHHAEPD